MKLTDLPQSASNEVKIDQNTIEFPNGLPGFEDCKHFKLYQSEHSTFIFRLQSTDDPDVRFTLADPDLHKVSYELTLTEEEQSMLKIDADDECTAAVILLRQAENNLTEQNTIVGNFSSPIVFNVTKRIGLQKQIIKSELTIRA